MHDQSAATSGTPRVPGYAWYTAAVLSLAYMFSQIDRMILNLLVEPIRHDLGITDTQIGLLQGFAFSIAVGFAGIPIAWAADRHSRRTIAGIGTIFWSLMTILCGMASNFTHLFAARFGLGIGESALSPASYSMLGDLFPREKLGRALGINMVGGTLGVGLASVAGGPVILALEKVGPVAVPLIGTLQPWQLAFPIAGLPALIVGLWVWSLREPPRRVPPSARGATTASWGEVFAFMRQQWRLIFAIFAGFSLLILVSQAITSWFPTFLIRQFRWDVGSVGIAFGLILGGAGTAAALGGGWLMEIVQRHGHADAPLRIGWISAAILGVCGVLAPLAPTATLALALFAPTVIVIVFGVMLAGVAIQIITPSPMRARVTALYFFVTQLISGGLGPLVVGLITDYAFGDAAAISYSLAIVAGVVSPFAAICIASGMAAYRTRIAGIDAEAAAQPSVAAA